MATLLVRFLTETPSAGALAFWPVVGLFVTMLLGMPRRHWWLVVAFFGGVDLVLVASIPERLSQAPVYLAQLALQYVLIVTACGLLIRRHGSGLRLHRLTPDLRDFAVFAVGLSLALAVAGLFGPTAAAGAFTVTALHQASIGALTSIVIVVPCGLSWLAPPRVTAHLQNRGALIEIAVLFGLLVAIVLLGLRGGGGGVRSIIELPELLIPFVLWSTFRFDHRITSLVLLFAAIYVSVQLAEGAGPFARISEDVAIQALAAGWFLCANCVAALLAACFVANGRRQATEGARARAFLRQFERAVRASFYEIRVGRKGFVYLEGALARRDRNYELLMRDADLFLRMVHPDDHARVAEIWRELRKGRLRDVGDVSYRFVPDEQTETWVRSLAVPVVNDSGEVESYLGITYDISREEQLRLEQAELRDVLRESDKLHAIGALGAGLAHNWNNLLFVLSAETEELESKLDRYPELRETAEALREVVEQGTGISRQMVELARRDYGPFRVVDLYDEVSRAIAMLSRTLPASIRIHPPPRPKLPLTVRTRASYLHQVILNLALNARDALEAQDGNLHFSLEGPVRGDRLGRDSSYVLLGIRDDGPGMTRDVKGSIFKPLFTTRGGAGGTGLGLTVVQSLVAEMGGRIDVESEPGQGARFVVTLPLNIGDEETAGAVAEAETARSD